MTRQTMSTHRSPPMAVESHFNPAASAGGSTSSRRSVATSGWSRRAGFPRGSHQTETGSPMAWPIKAAVRSMSRRPPVVQRRLWLQVSTGHSPQSGRRTGDICCSGVSASAALQQRTTSIGTWRRLPGGSAAPVNAREVLLREGFQAFQGLPFPDAWERGGKPHPLSRQGRRLLEHMAGRDLTCASDQRNGAARDVRHDGRSVRLADF